MILTRGKSLQWQLTVCKILIFVILFNVNTVTSKLYYIDTSAGTIKDESNTEEVTASKEKRYFQGPNEASWNYSVAVFNLAEDKKSIFSSSNTIVVKGSSALSITTTGDFTVGTNLDLSGQPIVGDSKLYHLGGFIRSSNSCCVLGAGPGAGFSYHGGGHGGRGGGFYQDRNTSRYYGWQYHNMDYLLGGSTGTVLFSSKPGSGGGAIEIKVSNGKLTIDSEIRSDGYTSANTSSSHCAGGSSGGLIRLSATTVEIGAKGRLSAVGGNSGYSSNHTKHCGGGGGGGVIQVFTERNITKSIGKSWIQADGGYGLERGENGVEWVGIFFDSGALEINTADCTMTWKTILLHHGTLASCTYHAPGDSIPVDCRVCHFQFHSSIHLGKGATLSIVGENAMKISSSIGNVEVFCSIDVNGDKATFSKERFLGGFVMSSLTGKNAGPGKVSGCNATGLYEHDFDSLVGGSVCNPTASADPGKAAGGGAIELVALNGKVKIGSKISANGFSSKGDLIGAMGGTIRVHGKTVVFETNASLSAKSSDGSLASGGVIQIKSEFDVQGLCESRFDVSGGSNGLVNVMVSTKESFQVQFIQSGTLQIDTTSNMWIYRTEYNSTIAYSLYGSRKTVLYDGKQYNISLFNFNAPIIINGSAQVQVYGSYGLSIKSVQGIYIGADFVLGMDQQKPQPRESFVGGFCVTAPDSLNGNGPGGGYTNASAGGGHGGKGGRLFEDSGRIYGSDYGFNPAVLIGGSAGSSRGGCLGCGGPAISISTPKSLTLNAAITANGFLKSHLSSSKVSYGGSSGGTIILKAKQVTLDSGARLVANGSNAYPPDASDTGGGSGGVIVIDSELPLVGDQPTPNRDTGGGRGGIVGENGVVVINGVLYRYPTPVNDTRRNYTGCYRINGDGDRVATISLLAHKTDPDLCSRACHSSGLELAALRGRTCKCYINPDKEPVSEDACNVTCPASSKLICGGQGNDIYSLYETGFVRITTSPPTEPTQPTAEPEPTTRSPVEPSEEFKELAGITITPNNSQTVVQDLKNLTSSSTLNGGDTWAAVSVLENLATGKVLAPSNVSQAKQAGQAIVDIASTLMRKENRDSWGVLESHNTSKRVAPYSVLKAVEQIAMDLGTNLKEDQNVTIESEIIAMGIETNKLDSFQGGTYPKYDLLTSRWASVDMIYVPKETVDEFKAKGESRATAVYVIYNGVTDLLNTGILQKDMHLNSRVMAFGFDKPLHNPLKKPVQMCFKKKEDWKNITKLQCSFIDFKRSSLGSWSNEGCNITSSSEEPIVECDCNHLTNFAILMQVKEFKISRADLQALEMITYVGCGISLFGLALTLATFLSLETLASERTSIHKNLVVAIGLAQIIFLAGIDSANPIACKVVALSLHYLYTAAFTWMCCEGVHLYTKIIEVFSSEGSKMKYYYLLGWGAPLIIVIISAAARFEGYGSEKACWISIKQGLIWAFVGPVLVIMAVNFVVMVMVIKVILASVTSIQNPNNTSQVKAGLKGMVVLMPLLGLTWVFGLMAVDERTLAFQYIFAILNSLQGLFIFAFHCIGNSEVRIAYKRLHEKRTLNKSLPEHSLSSVQHNKDLKRRMNSRETNSTGDEDVIVTKTIRSVSDVKLSGDHMAMQTFGGDTDSGRWSLNCPSPDPPVESFHSRRA